MRYPLLAASFFLVVSSPAWPQSPPTPAPSASPPTVGLRGVIERIAPDHESLDLRAADGQEKTLLLSRDAKVARAVPAKLTDVKPGVYVGVASLSAGDAGPQKALEIHIFPESMRGVGEGSRPFDLAPGSAMTNGAVGARVERVDGPEIIVAYAGGEQTIAVDKSTPVVALEAGGLGDLTIGASIVARGSPADGGAYKVARIVVGVEGVKPPM